MARDRFSVTKGNTQKSGFLRRAAHRLVHRRIVLFWTVATLSLAAPWLPGPGGGATVAKAETGQQCDVLNIHDGDTMTVSCAGRKIRVRLYCIDAPEMGQKPWGRESRDHLRSLTGPTVRLVVHDHDRYGRTVGELYSGGVNLNLAQVRDGWAADYRRYCPKQTYAVAAARAEEAREGIWARPGEQQTPWKFRHSH